MKETVVVALGGNALIKPGEEGTASQMRKNIRQALENILDAVSPEAALVITHGNGPQVGTLLLKDDAGTRHYGTVSYPLDMLVAETQGELGYLIESELRNLLTSRGIDREAATLVTMVEVSPDDPGFSSPQKRVGKMYSEDEARVLEKEKKWRFAPEIKQNTKGYRRVVASPKPLALVNGEALKTLVQRGFITVTAGGGGIPVMRIGGKLMPVAAVIDKDLASALVAREVRADRFIILTDVPAVYVGFAGPRRKALEYLRLEELDKLTQAGEFGKGNMLPKIQAARDFVLQTGKEALITDFEGLKKGKGTRIGP